MKLFRNKEINSKLDEILKAMEDEKTRRDNWEKNKENMLFETIEQKEKLLKEKIVLNDALNVKEKLNTDLEKENASLKKTIKELSDEINSLVKCKNENENLKKEVTTLEKKIEKYKENGVVIPKRITPAVPRTVQKIKETIRPVKN